tara:strand:- start:1358 stop:2101 length:744 start_codon:yes stop_codon:yes gene_type:complete
MIYVINLKHRKDRLLSITQQLKYKPYRIIEAIDGIQLYEDLEYREEVSNELDIPLCFFQEEWINSRSNFATMSNRIEYKYRLISCFCSHLKALRAASQDDLPNPLIMEDDAVVVDSDFLDFKLPDNYDIVHISPLFNLTHYDNIDINGGLQPINLNYPPWSCCAYFVKNPKLIHSMLFSGFKHGRGKRKAKHKDGTSKIIISSMDSWYKNNVFSFNNSYFVKPVLIKHGDNMGSDLGHTYKKCWASQ